MKLMKYSWLAALPMIFTACQDDTLVENHQAKIYTLSAQVDGGTAMSRAQIQLNNPNSGDEHFFWNAGDQFNVYQNVNDSYRQSTFSISGSYEEPTDGGKTSAVFSTTNPALATVDYIAVYPTEVAMDNKRFQMSIQTSLDFSSSSKEEVWKDYFKRNMYMLKAGSFGSADNATIQFNHLCALARITYTNNTTEEQTLNGFRLWSYGDQKFGTTLVYNAQDKTSTNSINTDWYEIYTNGLTVSAGESTDLYALFFPTDFADCDFYITLMTGNGDKTVSMPMSDIAAANPNATGFEAAKRYWFKLTQNGDGMVWTKKYEAELQQNVVFTNKPFAKALYGELGADVFSFDADSNGVMKQMDVNAVTELVFNNLEGDNYAFSTLDGIENFKNLTELECVAVGLTDANLKGNTALTKVNLTGNTQLTNLNLTDLKDLQTLMFSETAINTFAIDDAAIANIEVLHFGRLTDGPSLWAPEVDRFTNLLDLACYGQSFSLTNGDIKSRLQQLQCYDCGMESLDLTEYPNLELLNCYRNNFTELAIPANSKLWYLNCFGNKLTSLDITPLDGQLTFFICGNQQIDDNLNVYMTEAQESSWNLADTGWYASNPDLNANVNAVVSKPNTIDVLDDGTIIFKDVAFSSLLLSQCSEVGFTAYNGIYASISAADAEALTTLSIDGGGVKVGKLSTGFPYFTKLNELYLKNIGLTSLDVSQNTALTKVDCSNNALTEVKLPAGLKSLILNDNSTLKALDVTAMTALEELRIDWIPSISSLDLSNNTQLKTLSCQGTDNLLSLDLSNNSLLEFIDYGTTNRALDLSHFTNLKNLYYYTDNENTSLTFTDNLKGTLEEMCYRSPVHTSLDFTGFTKLRKLNCSDCQNLTSLTLGTLPDLTILECLNSRLLTLDLSGCTALQQLWCRDNQLDALDISPLTQLGTEEWLLEVGNQKDKSTDTPKTLTLTLTEAQNETWNSVWSNNGHNANVSQNILTNTEE